MPDRGRSEGNFLIWSLTKTYFTPKENSALVNKTSSLGFGCSSEALARCFPNISRPRASSGTHGLHWHHVRNSRTVRRITARNSIETMVSNYWLESSTELCKRQNDERCCAISAALAAVYQFCSVSSAPSSSSDFIFALDGAISIPHWDGIC